MENNQWDKKNDYRDTQTDHRETETHPQTQTNDCSDTK